MAWLKLTCMDDTKTLLNIDKILGVTIESGTIVTCEGQINVHVKESLEEIEAMLNKNEQPVASESVAKDVGRDYIGSDGDYKTVRDI